jgi:hypothetical protein
MRPGKHNLHFLVDVELLPHAFVNIPDEKMHIEVFISVIYLFIMYISNFIPMYLFIAFYLLQHECNSY